MNYSREGMQSQCRYCMKWFYNATNKFKIFCSEHCRKKNYDKRKRDENESKF